MVVNVFGDDLDVLDANGARGGGGARRRAGRRRRAGEVAARRAPHVAIRLRPERLARLGFRPVDVLDAVQTAYQGSVVAQMHRANQMADVVVILDAGEPRATRRPGRAAAAQRRRAARAARAWPTSTTRAAAT